MTTDLDAAPPAGAVRLPDWGLILARGADARSFLHTQLTQDIESLAPDAVRLAGYCSPKGRLLATFVAWSPVADEVWLACSADLLPQTLKRLAMFVLRAKCRLEDASPAHAVWGVASTLPPGLAPGRHVADGARRWLRLADAPLGDAPAARRVARALCVTPHDAGPPAAPVLDLEAWRFLEVASAVPRITAATADKFVPQMVNLEVTGGVDFRKGCYPGQEVVARSQYRGTLKRRGALVACERPLEAGAEVFDATDPDQPAGELVLGADWGGRHLGFAELKLAALGRASLHLGSADGPGLSVLPLPYALPADPA